MICNEIRKSLTQIMLPGSEKAGAAGLCESSVVERVFISIVMHVRMTSAQVVRNEEVINHNAL